MEEFKEALTECAMASGELEPCTLTEEDLAAIRKLRDEKYATWAWNYGFSPAYDMRREMKFPAGLVTAHLSAEGGKIKAVRFYGDFFGGELGELEGGHGWPAPGRAPDGGPGGPPCGGLHERHHGGGAESPAAWIKKAFLFRAFVLYSGKLNQNRSQGSSEKG